MAATKGVHAGGGIHVFMPNTWNGYGQIPAGWSDPSPPATYKPAFGVIRFENWWRGAAGDASAQGGPTAGWPGNQFGTLRTGYTHRQPRSAYFAANIYDRDPYLGTITPSQEQAYADAQIQAAADAGITYLAFDWYPTVALQDLANYPSEQWHENLRRGWDLYQSSPNKSLVKWCWYPSTLWMRDDAHAAVRLQHMVSCIDDQYMRVHPSRPVFHWFGDAAVPASYVTILNNACKAAGHGLPYIITSNMTYASTAACGAQARSGYGPLDHAPVASGQQAWSVGAARDKAVSWVASASANSVPHLSPKKDQGPIQGAAVFCDDATTSQWITHLKDCDAWIEANRANAPHRLALIYSWNELSEWGGIVPQDDDDYHGTGYGFAIDGLRHVMGISTLTTARNWVTMVNLTAGRITAGGTAAWTWTRSGVTGAYRSQITENATGGSWIDVAISGTGCEVWGSKGPSFGIASFQVDGGAATNVDCYSASTQRRQKLFDTGAIANGAHTIRINVTGTKNASSSGFNIGIEAAVELTAPP